MFPDLTFQRVELLLELWMKSIQRGLPPEYVVFGLIYSFLLPGAAENTLDLSIILLNISGFILFSILYLFTSLMKNWFLTFATVICYFYLLLSPQSQSRLSDSYFLYSKLIYVKVSFFATISFLWKIEFVLYIWFPVVKG